MKPKRTKVAKNNMDIIYGLIIGDGTLYKSARGNALLDIAHCPEQLGYLEWKEAKLIEFGFNASIKYKPPTVNSNFPKYRMMTNKDVFWTEIMAEMYSFRNTDQKKKKRITKPILDKCTLRTLALWYLDDGYNNQNRNYVHLGTYGFSYEENILIKDWILKLTGVEFKVYNRKGKYFLVSYEGANIFKEALINSIDIPECMAYKFT